jgi:histone deacetylase HOS3
MDACEHEYESMSRHGRKVPVSFYHQFTRDACAFSDRFAGGRIISVLEGGYSDRALISGTMAHISGLVSAYNDNIDDKVDRTWWDVDNLAKVSLNSPLCHAHHNLHRSIVGKGDQAT